MKDIFLVLFITIFFSLNKIAESQQRMELQNDKGGYYYTTILVGSPPQKQSVIVDIGSSAFLLQCSQCKDCHKPQQFQVYNQNQSSTYVPRYCKSKTDYCIDNCSQEQELCQRTFKFVDGQSYQTNPGTQIMRLSQKGSDLQVILNCVNKEINQTLPRNGILGLGPSVLKSIVYDWFNMQNMTDNMKFSICLAANGGYLEFGLQQNKNYSDAQQIEVTFIDFQEDYCTKQFYAITFNGIDIFDRDIALFPASIFPNSSYTRIISQLNKICNPLLRICLPINPMFLNQNSASCYVIQTTLFFSKSKEEYFDDIFPNFEMLIGNVSVIWKPSEYLQITTSQNYIIGCLYIYPNLKQKYLLGQNWMRNKKFIFDLNKKSIKIILNYQCQQYFKSNNAISIGKNIIIYLCVLLFISFVFMRDKIVRRYRKYKNSKVEMELQETGQNSSANFENNDIKQ